jgi:radical SAM superfamily enzyme YgiQ (UPF0313 family)
MFVFPPAPSTLKGAPTHFRMSLGSAYIIAYLQQHGYRCGQLEPDRVLSIPEAVNLVLARNPRIVGFTVYHPNFSACRLMALRIKAARPDIIIIFGGATPTVQAREVLRACPAVDICVVNAGEDTALEILSTLDDYDYRLDKAPLDKIHGIVFRDEENYIQTPRRKPAPQWENKPDPLDKYPSPYLAGIVKSTIMGTVSARGCVNFCVFCNCTALCRRRVLTHSTDRLVQELDYIARRLYTSDINVVDIMDDAFTLFPERVMEICNKIIENKIKLPLVCITRCDYVNEEILDKLREAGFKSIGFSLESAVPRVLRMSGKLQPPRILPNDNFEKERDFLERFKKYTVYAKKIGFETVYSSIILGLPTETPEEGRETIRFIESMQNELDFYAHNSLKIFPGTPLFYSHKKYGYRLKPLGNGIHFRTVHPYDTTRIEAPPKPLSTSQQFSIDKDNLNIKTMSLPPSDNEFEANPPLHFENIIFLGDRITEELAVWVRDYLIVNGNFMQIYSGYEIARQHYEDDSGNLVRFSVPTNLYSGYYRTVTGNHSETLTPYRMHETGEYSGFRIQWHGVASAFSDPPAAMNPMQVLCVEKTTADALRLYDELKRFSRAVREMEQLEDLPVPPYFSALCRWRSGSANCRTLQTVIVDAGHNIRTCWNGEPVGKVGMPLERIYRSLRSLEKEITRRRNCGSCHRQPDCSACLFPHPLEEQDYCRLRKDFTTEIPAGIILNIEGFKEYAY